MRRLIALICAWVLLCSGKVDAGVSCVDDLLATGGVNEIILTWTGTGDDHYNVYRGTISGGPYLKIAATPLTTYTDMLAVVAGTTYYYVIRPVDAADNEICQSNESDAVASDAPTETPTVTPTETPTVTPSATPTETRAPLGGSCADSSDCVPFAICINGTCTAAPAPVPATSNTGLLIALTLLSAIGAVAIQRRRGHKPE
jgi:hypothetical protein